MEDESAKIAGLEQDLMKLSAEKNEVCNIFPLKVFSRVIALVSVSLTELDGNIREIEK